MNVLLVDKLEESLNQHVKQGRCRSASEVVRQGLRILEIREALVRANLVDCIVALLRQLFYNAGIPACLWFLRRGRPSKESLFIDASSMGFMEDRTHRAFAIEDITKIRDANLNWCLPASQAGKGDDYEDEKGLNQEIQSQFSKVGINLKF